jgi:transposase
MIARSVGISRTAIGEYMRRAAVIGITWPVQQELDDAALFAPAGYNPLRSKRLPEWEHIHAELRRRGVTMALLWEEYPGHYPDGYGHSRFCDLYVEWRHGITATMRQTQVAGEKLFVDFAGDTLPVFDGLTGEVRAAKIFAAVLGASNCTFAQARFGEALPDRTRCDLEPRRNGVARGSTGPGLLGADKAARGECARSICVRVGG